MLGYVLRSLLQTVQTFTNKIHISRGVTDPLEQTLRTWILCHANYKLHGVKYSSHLNEPSL